MMELYLGIDVGSVTTKLATLDSRGILVDFIYLPTYGNPRLSITKGLASLKQKLPYDFHINRVAITGSARRLAGEIVGADIIKNEITAQSVAAISFLPQVSTIIEIGGQDSKLIIIKDGLVTYFSMNTICAAGTGSFLDHQARRLNLTIEELSSMATKSTNPISISGRCTVFAESDMINRQQSGRSTEDIVYGLCKALVRNFSTNVGLRKALKPPFIFHGGVAFNQGMVRAFEEYLDHEIIIPPHPEITGAVGSALIAIDELSNTPNNNQSLFKGFNIA
jgi:predicted CoA-substrate-specific enzyme activase